jgi:NAD(P)-dependent dehydrogenase (short-subunit alcohol dehydrogenase family)
MIDLTGRVALVTGSSRGIGAGIARVLAEYGADIAVNYVSGREQAEGVAAHIQALGRRTHIVQADVTDLDAVQQMVADVEQALGPISILVNNAGKNNLKNIMDISSEDWDWTLNLNLKSYFLCSKAVLPGMIARQHGHIINITSISGQRGGLICDVDYSAAKAGIMGFTRSLARWAAPHGVLVNAVAPGYFDTGWEQRSDPERIRRLIETIPLRRFGLVEEIGEIVAFLCGPGGNYIVGEVITANGGVHIA